ncbi:LytTR family DNA-binding domain-containing protein [Aequorivita sp. Q41]|uniref:LytR/AlgR family response regulator transcription factor n=1 Tax=Aequorivita sp. Q41 TaxID=3153300 RepID=UPI003242D07B
MIKAILIDDEERARRVLKNLIETYCTDIQVVAVCSNIPEAVLKINEYQPDVVFCDIEMPEYTGLELLNFFNEINFELIFATGYSEFALQAFEVSAIDYLLKPIQIDKLENAVKKLKEKLHSATMHDRLETLKENLKENVIQRIALPVSDGLIFVELTKISLLDADGAYTKVWLKDGTNILVSKNLKFFENLLGNREQFFRIHRSSIVNLNSIKKYSKAESYILMDNNTAVKIARDKKSEFEDYLTVLRLR